MSGRDLPSIDYYLCPGDIYLSHELSLVSTVLGSSVAVSLWDSERMLGGMVHFLYPFTADRRMATARYGNVAVRGLVKMLLEDGSREKDLKAQLFGGAQSAAAACVKNARENIRMARMILRSRHIALLSEDTGGSMGRKVIYNTHTNETLVYKVNHLRRGDWYPYIHEGKNAEKD